MDGSYGVSAMVLGDLHYTAYSKAAWQPDGSLKLWIRPIETAHERRFAFHFNPDGTVQVKNEMEPKFEDLVIYNFVFLGLPLPNTGSENFCETSGAPPGSAADRTGLYRQTAINKQKKSRLSCVNKRDFCMLLF